MSWDCSDLASVRAVRSEIGAREIRVRIPEDMNAAVADGYLSLVLLVISAASVQNACHRGEYTARQMSGFQAQL